jgi:mono/diheme cytochrome c family protein
MITNLRFLKCMAMIFLLVPLFACGSESQTAEAPTTTDPAEVARPSNPGGAGEAVKLAGNPKKGAAIFNDKCISCHNVEGKGGISNPGSTDGTVPSLNPIDPTLYSQDYKTFATNIDLFIQHGSTPEGSNPLLSMPAVGDQNRLTQQQIADVIAYVISLNKK